MIPLHGDVLADQPLDIAQVVALVWRAEGNGEAVGAGAGGAADPMHVGLGLVRQVEVHDEADALHVEQESFVRAWELPPDAS